MSILIKDMEMPKSCRDCELMVDCDGCEGWQCYCPLIGYIGYMSAANPSAKIISTDKREENCPLIELRLIDESEVMQRLGITDMDCTKCAWGNHGFCGRGGDFNDACEAIEEATTIIEAEEGET